MSPPAATSAAAAHVVDRRPDVRRTPEIGRSTPELRERLQRIWETKPGLYGWFATVDHKEIGIRYIVTAFVMLVIGGIEGLIMRVQLAGPELTVLRAYLETLR